MAGCSSHRNDYSWQECEDFQLPNNSVWYGTDDDGSDIFCGKAWCDGKELPAKIIPDRRECRVIDNGTERVVPKCRKVLVCRDSTDNQCNGRRQHHHRRRHHCHNGCSCESDVEEETTTTTSTSNKNESRLIIRSIKCRSSETTTVVKKNRKEHKRKNNHVQCWDQRRTRMVPKVTMEPKVRYVPKVTMERTVRYEPETYVTQVCCDNGCDDGCEPCEPCEPCRPCEPCEPWYPYDNPCENRCRKERECEEMLVCERPKKNEGRCVRPTRCDPPSPKPKSKCW